MLESRLKELENWAQQAMRDGQGNIHKLGDSIIELVTEVRRLRGWAKEIHVKSASGVVVLASADEAEIIEAAFAVMRRGEVPEIFCASETEAARIANLFSPSQVAKMKILSSPPPP